MQITCTECKKPINIPDDKIPRDKAFNLTCPFCKGKVKVDQHLQSRPGASAQDAAIDATATVVSEDFDEDDQIKFVEEGKKLALVLDNRHKEQWKKVLAEHDYFVDGAKSPEHAVHKMKFTQYDAVIIDEAYHAPLEQNAAFQALAEMQMVSRRKIFAVLVGAELKSMNNMQAYQHNVDLVVCDKDLDKLTMILKKSLADHENFYKVYKDTMHTLGKV
jgi:hypothetical protein